MTQSSNSKAPIQVSGVKKENLFWYIQNYFFVAANLASFDAGLFRFLIRQTASLRRGST